MAERPEYLSEQLITYIGNKRALLPFLEAAVDFVRARLGKEKLRCLDVFSGSGIVSRFLKSRSSFLAANDLELYAQVISRCYLANESELNLPELRALHARICAEAERRAAGPPAEFPGFISELYAPRDAADVKAGERCFYTPENARRIDWTRRLIGELAPEAARPFFIAPLLSQASVHANTAGIFKGFYKNSRTGVGQFGGNGRNALSRICGKIVLPFPVFSASSCPTRVFRQEAAALAASEELYGAVPGGTLDLAYIDPPYNQHPYGSNYFMLNLIASYERPSAAEISRVAGIPKGWNRSAYNKRRSAAAEFRRLVSALRARFLLVSFNSEGFIRRNEMEEILGAFGTVTVFEAPYNTFRGSRNLRERSIHLREYLFALEKERL